MGAGETLSSLLMGLFSVKRQEILERWVNAVTQTEGPWSARDARRTEQSP